MAMSLQNCQKNVAWIWEDLSVLFISIVHMMLYFGITCLSRWVGKVQHRPQYFGYRKRGVLGKRVPGKL